MDTVPEPAQRNAGNLAPALAAANEARKLTRKRPTWADIEDWIERAEVLSRRLEF